MIKWKVYPGSVVTSKDETEVDMNDIEGATKPLTGRGRYMEEICVHFK